MVQMYDETVNEDAEGVLPRFYVEAVRDDKASEEAGHECFKEQEWIEMRVRGDHTMVNIQRVTDRHRQRFATAYKAFSEGKEQKYGDGMPLEQWPLATQASIKMWNAQQVYTVEQVANFSDTFIHKIRGGQSWKQKAARWLADRDDVKQEVTALKELVEKQSKELRRLSKRGD